MLNNVRREIDEEGFSTKSTANFEEREVNDKRHIRFGNLVSS